MQINLQKRKALGDLGLLVAVGLGALILFIGAADLPPPKYEPMGSAAMPRILGVIMLLLSLPIAFRAIRVLTRSSHGKQEPEAPVQLPYRGVLIFAALVLYVAALDFGRAPFVPATTVFVAASAVAINGPRLRTALIYTCLGLALSLVLSYIFSNFLYVTFG